MCKHSINDPTSTFCNIGANEGRSVLFLIGNSHADAIGVVGDIGSNNASSIFLCGQSATDGWINEQVGV